jgi:hypothetical protein
MNSIIAIDSEVPFVLTETAISDTVRRINVEALDLLSRRAEINRRIRSLYQLMHGLRGLTATTPPAVEATIQHATPEHDPRQTMRLEPDRAEFSIGRLSRACRIALLETEGCASVDEILSRIVRRGSFLFSDSKCPQTEIHHALMLMAEKGEILLLDDGPELAWQRLSAASAPDISD